MAIDLRNLVDASMRLRAAAPDEWEKFVHAMREYGAASTTDMLRAAPELLLKAQGMAVQANEIAGILRDCAQLQEKFLMASLQAKRNPINA